MALTDNKGDQDDKEEGEIVAVEGLAEGTVEKTDDEQQATGEDSRLAAVEDEDDEENVAGSPNEEIRAARRAERQARKARERVARERDRREMDFLRNRNESLERRFSVMEGKLQTTQVLTIDDRIAQTKEQIKLAENVEADAIKNQKGDEAVEARGIRDRLAHNLSRLEAAREQAARPQQGEQRQQREAPQSKQGEAPDPQLLRHADAWRKKNTWFKDDGTDEDSSIVSTVDNRMVAEGFDPVTPEYWTELDKRLKRYLPHRFQANGNGSATGGAQTNGQQPRGPAMANGNRGPALKPGEVYVSPERRSAMQELGVWDDPVLRKKYLKRYADYDRDAARR